MCLALIFPASLMAAIIFTWSAICSGDPSAEITTSTCLIAFTKLSWWYMSPCETITWLSRSIYYSKVLKTHPQCGELEFVHTWRSVTPELLKLSMSLDFSGLEVVFSLTNAKVGCPAFTLSSTMYLPMYPVPPIIKILLFWAIQREFQTKRINRV